MTSFKARVVLISVFLAAFVMQAGAFVYAFLREHIYDDELLDLLLTLLKIYSVPLAVAGVGFFVKQAREKTVKGPLFWVAFAFCLLWNLLLLWRSFVFGVFSVGTNSETSDYLMLVSSVGSFLIAGVLTFFFTKQT